MSERLLERKRFAGASLAELRIGERTRPIAGNLRPLPLSAFKYPDIEILRQVNPEIT